MNFLASNLLAACCITTIPLLPGNKVVHQYDFTNMIAGFHKPVGSSSIFQVKLPEDYRFKLLADQQRPYVSLYIFCQCCLKDRIPAAERTAGNG